MARRAPTNIPRRRKQWNGIPGIQQPLTVDAVTTFCGSLAFAGGGLTILRMMGEYIIGPDQDTAPVANDAVVITVGIAVVNQDAIDSATQVAVPDPSRAPTFRIDLTSNE